MRAHFSVSAVMMTPVALMPKASAKVSSIGDAVDLHAHDARALVGWITMDATTAIDDLFVGEAEVIQPTGARAS